MWQSVSLILSALHSSKGGGEQHSIKRDKANKQPETALEIGLGHTMALLPSQKSLLLFHDACYSQGLVGSLGIHTVLNQNFTMGAW